MKGRQLLACMGVANDGCSADGRARQLGCILGPSLPARFGTAVGGSATTPIKTSPFHGRFCVSIDHDSHPRLSRVLALPHSALVTPPLPQACRSRSSPHKFQRRELRGSPSTSPPPCPSPSREPSPPPSRPLPTHWIDQPRIAKPNASVIIFTILTHEHEPRGQDEHEAICRSRSLLIDAVVSTRSTGRRRTMAHR